MGVNLTAKIKEKWKNGLILGFDCITFSSGKIVIAEITTLTNLETGKIVRYWNPLCDTELDKIEKYNDDIWTPYDIFSGSFEMGNQRIVFGDGAMGNEGFIASTTLNGDLNWSIFLPFLILYAKLK